jgi:hypothetical protein
LFWPMTTTCASAHSGADSALFVMTVPLVSAVSGQARPQAYRLPEHACEQPAFDRRHVTLQTRSRGSRCDRRMSVTVRTERGARRGHRGGARARSKRRNGNQRGQRNRRDQGFHDTSPHIVVMGDGTAAASRHCEYLSRLNIFARGPVQGSSVLAPAQRCLADGAWPHIRIVSGAVTSLTSVGSSGPFRRRAGEPGPR